MSACPSWQESLIAAALGELSNVDQPAFESHLEGCSRCAAELEELREDLALIARELPAPAAGDLDVFSTILPSLDAIDEGRRPRSRFVLSHRTAAAYAALLLALGLGLGLFLRTDSPSTQPTVVANDELTRLLERAIPLVLAVANAGAEEAVLASFEHGTARRLAAELAQEAGSMAAELAGRGERRRARLVSDLGLVLQQISDLPREDLGRGFRDARDTLEARALLFQVSAEHMRSL